MGSSEVFVVSEDDEKKLFKLRKYTPEKNKEFVKELEEWIKTQPHLPQTLPFEDLLERAFYHCWQKIDLAKKRLDLHFTYKNKNRDFYKIFGTEKFILPSQNSMQVAILPNLYKNGERVGVAYLTSTDVEEYELDHIVQIAMAGLELAFKYDRARGCIVVVDCEGFDINWTKKTDLSKLLRLVTHIHEAYLTRVAGVHLLNAGSALQFIINLCKQFISGKLFSRLNIHENLESLHEMVEAKYLPAEFGGTCGTMKDLTGWNQLLVIVTPFMKVDFPGKMDRLVLQNRDYLAECGSDKFVADESKRTTNDYNASTFGVDIFF